MSPSQIKALQRRIGVDDDGYWGPISTDVAKQYLRQFMPKENPWPKSDQASLQAFYGSPGDEENFVQIDVSGLGVKYSNQVVNKITCHSKVAHSLSRVLERIASSPWRWVLEKYDGCYANRSMRGSSTPSLHARAAAIDFWAAKNGNHDHWPTKAELPIEVMEFFATEGWLSAGAFWSRDAMHFQATR